MSTPEAPSAAVRFDDLNLPADLLQALNEIGYETPTPIQAQAIPSLMEGRDLLGHAPTGTGKTAAFALPLLAQLNMKDAAVQVMCLTPTRELAIQVAEAFGRYAGHIKGFNVLPIYGGQEYGGQLRQLKRGVQVVVGTPGRVMDHMRRGTLKLGGLKALVLDEADEMLRMGFLDEVEWILEQTPDKRQMALFSATMPRQIERIARKHLNSPHEISIEARSATAETIRQRYWKVTGVHKLDALTRILEVETFDAILIFVRTKNATTMLAEKLEARGYAAAAMNGDLVQKQREQLVERLKKGSLDILVATDIAARGLDVERVSHVINYDIPSDTESYIHRIGRTGRAGRNGDAILFVAPRERRMLQAIERATRQPIEKLHLPTTEAVNEKRIADFKKKITDVIAGGELAFTQHLVEQYQQENDVPALDIAAALAKMAMGDNVMLVDKERPASTPHSDADKETFRIEVGYEHDVKPGNIVAAIANAAGLDGGHIGHINIDQTFTLVDLPKGMPGEIFKELKRTVVCGQKLEIRRVAGGQSKDRKGAKGFKKPSDSGPGKKPGQKPGKKPGKKPGHKKNFKPRKPAPKKAPGKKRNS